MGRLMNKINGWRHRRGFGVHSPLAFELVKEVFWPDGRYAYYEETHSRADGADARLRSLYRRRIRLYHTLRRHGIGLRTQLSSPADRRSDFLSTPDRAEWRPLTRRERENPDLIPGNLVLLIDDTVLAINLGSDFRQVYDFR